MTCVYYFVSIQPLVEQLAKCRPEKNRNKYRPLYISRLSPYHYWPSTPQPHLHHHHGWRPHYLEARYPPNHLGPHPPVQVVQSPPCQGSCRRLELAGGLQRTGRTPRSGLLVESHRGARFPRIPKRTLYGPYGRDDSPAAQLWPLPIGVVARPSRPSRPLSPSLISPSGTCNWLLTPQTSGAQFEGRRAALLLRHWNFGGRKSDSPGQR
ncbi:hypothetical protein Cgig2_001995 [Carnegiea gigantea]|uniref:Uncharacterized protein n=1 Tax=Carnegiea gigantea TaxID=171969 RepID=A0A9Q1GK66_9CARY|nr:hypothetical protein Cgig2_001995 [Carnegiea gigantea]